MILSLTEVTMYLVIFAEMYKSNKQVIGLVSPTIIQKRNQSNIMTLWGQAVAFAGNFFVLTLLMAFLNLAFIRQFVEEATYPIVISFTGALTSIVDLYSSPEMRKFLFEKKDQN